MSDRSSNPADTADRFSPALVGLIPAGGTASRLQPLPCSKELLPVGFRWSDDPDRIHPKPVCVHLLESMRAAGVANAYIVLRRGKWDIPAYLGDGSRLKLNLAYLTVEVPYGVPFTVDQAFPFVHAATVVFGFPDILFQPGDAFRALLATLASSEAAIVLGLFPVSQPGSMDMVELEEDGRIRRIHIKPAATTLSFTWIIAAWRPAFTRFMHAHVAAVREAYAGNEKKPECGFSDVINAAISNHVRVAHVIFDDGDWLDIGSPDRLAKALRAAGDGSRPDTPQRCGGLPDGKPDDTRRPLSHPQHREPSCSR